jgi:adenylosuccinate synthase
VSRGNRVPGVAITGLQWGDEGKGKVIDNLAKEAEIVVRYQGGANAGHTILVGEEKYVLHVIPAGVLYEDKICVIGNGVVVDLESLSGELSALEERGVKTGNVFLSDRAHVVFPFHKRLDEVREQASGAGKIGTTKRGIGPCYGDKVSRMGIRVAELYDKDIFKKRLKRLVEEKNALFKNVYNSEPADYDDILEHSLALAEHLKDRILSTGPYLQEAIRQDKRILYEGAQGVMLDVDHGTFPYVTSSNASICGITAGAGVPPHAVSTSIGVIKAYCTRVGDGPFPTELDDEEGEKLREAGAEFGATTGRPRRCGHLDLLQVRYAVTLCGIRGLALTKLDVLAGKEKIKATIAYECDGQILTEFPASLDLLRRCKPVYRELKGFSEDITGVDALEDLPHEARHYIEFIEAIAGVPVIFLSTGPKRSQFFRRGHGEQLWDSDHVS